MALPRLLLIDDDKKRIEQFETILTFLQYQVVLIRPEGSISALTDFEGVRAVFVGHGCDKQATLIKSILSLNMGLPIILLTDKATLLQIPSAIVKMVLKVQEWPSCYSTFIETLKKLPVPSQPIIVKINNVSDKGLTGASSGIKLVRVLIDQVAKSTATVLILGESGTGKEVVAQALHRTSDRKNKPFVPINCGAIPAELLESELFGHEKGAFTGALTTRQGRFEMAEGGTLFLDEIGDMPMPMQVKLLRVLQEHTFERVGSNKTIQCDVRIVAATHRNLENEIEEKRFREDLFYRLNVFPIELPSLQERIEDIPLLVNDLIKRLGGRQPDYIEFSDGALALMMQHPWPGNIRELSNFIERLAITHPEGVIDVTDLPEKFQIYQVPEGWVVHKKVPEQIHEPMDSIEKRPIEVDLDTPVSTSKLPEQGLDLKEYLSHMEINLIRQALSETNGVVAHAAKRLNMRRTTLVEKLKKYELS